MDFFENKADCIDDLTKVYKREVIKEYVDSLIEQNKPFSLCILDLDNFKYINDGYGHKLGDRVLVSVANNIKKLLGDNGIVGRYGGDEFLIVLDNITDYDAVWDIWHTLLGATTNLDDKELNDLNMTVTMGASRFPKDSKTIDGLFELADKALYRGKMKGRNCFIIYLPEKHATINLKTERDRQVSSMYLHSKVYHTLNHSDSLSKEIEEVINYLGNYFMIDHLCLCDDKNMYFDYHHPISKKRDYKMVDTNELLKMLNPQTNIFCKNTIKGTENDLASKEICNQGIYSACYVEIEAYGKHYGFVRCDIVLNPRGRVWQNVDMDVLLTFAHNLALIMHYNKLELKDLKDK